MLNIPAGWKPIASAPKDGTEILAWREDCGQFIALYTSADAFPMTQDELDAWDEETLFAKDWFTQWPQAYRLEGIEVPTHWMPLPDAPGSSPSVAPGDTQDAAIAGALFDLMGFLTTLDEPVSLGSTEEAAIAVELLQRWAAKRGLNLDDADVKGWNERLTAPAAGDALDAKRYRWLRHEGREEKHQDDGAIYVRQVQLTSGVITGSAVLVEEDLDAAIDAALAAQVPQQGEA